MEEEEREEEEQEEEDGEEEEEEEEERKWEEEETTTGVQHTPPACRLQRVMVLVGGGFLSETRFCHSEARCGVQHLEPLNMLLLVCVLFVIEVQENLNRTNTH